MIQVYLILAHRKSYMNTRSLPLRFQGLLPARIATSSGAASLVAYRWFLACLVLAIWIFAIDVSWDRTNVSVLYVVPLLLLAERGELRHVRVLVLLMVLLTFSAYLIKKTLSPEGAITPYLHFSLFNRSLSALMLIAVGWAIHVWSERRNYYAPELPEDFRSNEWRVSALQAYCLCLPLIVLLAALDLFAPANYNLAILYLVPLFVCVWSGSRKLLWIVLATLVALAVIAYFVGPGPTDARPIAVVSTLRNRVVTVSVMLAVGTLLSTWIPREPRVQSRV